MRRDRFPARGRASPLDCVRQKRVANCWRCARHLDTLTTTKALHEHLAKHRHEHCCFSDVLRIARAEAIRNMDAQFRSPALPSIAAPNLPTIQVPPVAGLCKSSRLLQWGSRHCHIMLQML
eukprot:m51a1_g12975 hypothetical protein (121) ;mRNA; f:67-680